MTSTSATSHRATRTKSTKQQRKDIQGLRAIAVLLVITQHFWNKPEGGYIGVDIFFVLSGFLISGIILRDIQEYGHIRLPRFYARRLRRIAPVALFVSVITVALAWFTWFTPQALQYSLDAFWANLWVANWHFAAAGTDYLAHSANPSPFQHYWSLSVEEQFYVAWPLVLAAAWAIGTKLKNAERAIDTAIIITIVLSAVWAIFFTDYRAQWAYFDTISRAGEFALGALAARLAHKRNFPPLIGVLGLILILVSAFTFTSETLFPGPFALLPAIGTALILLPTFQVTPIAILIENPLMRWLGDISYSLYLWHFPVLIFMTTWFGSQPAILLSALAITIGLSALSYRFIENPIRHSSLLRSWETPVRNQIPSGWIKHSNLVSFGILACIASLTIWQFMPSKYGVLAPQTMNVQKAEATQTYSSVEEIQSAMSLTPSTVWSTDLIPSPNVLTQEQMGEAMAPSTSCAVGFGDTELELCEWGPAVSETAKSTTLVIGDSVAMAWTPAVIKASEPTTRIIAAGVGSCTIMSLRQEADFKATGFPEKCATTREALFALVEETQPDTVVIASAAGGYQYQLDEAGHIITDPAAQKENWQAGTEETLNRLQTLAPRVVLLGSPGITLDPRHCITRTGNVQDCTAELQDFQTSKEEAEQAAVEALAATGANIHRFDALETSCIDGACPVLIGPYITHTDPVHITEAYAQSLAPVIKPILYGE